MAQARSYPTIWKVSDDLWETIKLLLDKYDRPASTGRPRQDRRPVLNAIIHRFRSGSQWNHLPREFGDDSRIHRVFQHWVKLGIFAKLWAELLTECDELEQVEWDWQAADGWLGKARMGGDSIGPNPTDRAKNGTKKSLLTDGAGGPLSIVIAPANVNDHKLLEETLDSISLSGRKRRVRSHSICASIKVTTTSRVAGSSRSINTKTTSAGSEKSDSIKRAKRSTRRDATWLNELWAGYLNAEAC